jgi:hypothetical protein
MKPNIVATISFGTIDRENITVSFAREVLEQVRVPILATIPGEDYRVMASLWPDNERIERRPLESLRSGLTAGRSVLARTPGWTSMRYVLLLDEFTYLFEVLRRSEASPPEIAGVREFMRQWKALLESQYFSALVVGQDTMPYFMERFANEFSTMNSRRLSYLQSAETRRLADRPVLRDDGSSRYTGYALDMIYAYTDGHPYFTQIVCDRVIRLANEDRRSDISEGDVERAVESLVVGTNRLDTYRFDCLLTADNTGLVSSSSTPGDEFHVHDIYDDAGDAALRLLYRIANLGGQQNRPVSREELDLAAEEDEVLEDLLVREVLVERDGYVSIRVVLFSEHLRRM